jgi:hypothetical protein
MQQIHAAPPAKASSSVIYMQPRVSVFSRARGRPDLAGVPVEKHRPNPVAWRWSGAVAVCVVAGVKAVGRLADARERDLFVRGIELC